MNKKFIYSMFAVALLLTGCDYNEKHFPGYDEYTTPTDVQNDTITLLDADYKSISELKANQDIALSKDPEGKTYVDALDAVASNHFFTNDAQAVWYLPAYLDDTYPYLSDGSKITVNYNNYEDLPAYLTQLINANSYTLTPSDYRTVWGESISATFLSPSTIRQIPNILKEKISNPADGAVQAVSYVYSETEPSTGGGSEIPMVYKQVSDFNTEEGGVYVIAAQGKDGQYYPFGGELHAGDYGYMHPDPITVTDGIISSDDGNIYAITVATTANGYSLLNSRGQYLHMTGTHSTFDVANEFPSEGSDWSFNKNGNGTYSIVNIEKNRTIKLTIDEKYGYQYGSYPNYTFGSYYSGVTSNEDDGNLEAKDVTLPSGSTYVWKMDKEHGYWKGSSYVGGQNLESESWLITPEIDLTNANTPSLSFDMALNFLRGDARENHASVWISSDYTGNVQTATWEELNIENWPAGDGWDEINSGNIDLTQYKNKKIRIAFKYVGTTTAAPTWEVYNIKVVEPGEFDYWDVYLFQQMTETEAAAGTRATTRAAADVNATALYQYDADADAWVAYSNSNAQVSALQPSDYAAMGSSYVSDAATTLPIYLKQTYPYAQAEDVCAVLYCSNSDGDLAASEFVYDGANWTETTIAVPSTIIFLKSEGSWIEAKIYFEASLTGGQDGGFTTQDIELDETLSYAWILDNSYGWKASAYKGGNKKADSWLISPPITLEGSVAPVLKFELVINHLYGQELSNHFTIVVSTDYSDDATTATWSEPLAIDNLPEGNSYTFNEVTSESLAAYNGQTIHIGFHYISNDKAAPTIEFRNFSVQE